jgi:hypothetical protein
MKRKMLVLILAGLLNVFAGVSAFAAVSVQGKHYMNSSDCQNYITTQGVFVVNYENQELSPDAEVTLLYGMREQSSQNDVRHWVNPSRVRFSYFGGQLWKAHASELVSLRNGFNYSAIEFVVEIKLPNGHVYKERLDFERPNAYFSAEIPSNILGCNNDSADFVDLSLQEVIEYR